MFCNRNVDIYLYKFYLKNKIIINDQNPPIYPCFDCKCMCNIPLGHLRENVLYVILNLHVIDAIGVIFVVGVSGTKFKIK